MSKYLYTALVKAPEFNSGNMVSAGFHQFTTLDELILSIDELTDPSDAEFCLLSTYDLEAKKIVNLNYGNFPFQLAGENADIVLLGGDHDDVEGLIWVPLLDPEKAILPTIFGLEALKAQH